MSIFSDETVNIKNKLLAPIYLVTSTSFEVEVIVMSYQDDLNDYSFIYHCELVNYVDLDNCIELIISHKLIIPFEGVKNQSGNTEMYFLQIYWSHFHIKPLILIIFVFFNKIEH